MNQALLFIFIKMSLSIIIYSFMSDSCRYKFSQNLNLVFFYVCIVNTSWPNGVPTTGWLTKVTKNSGPQNKTYAVVITRNILTLCTPSISILLRYSFILLCSSSAPHAWNQKILVVLMYMWKEARYLEPSKVINLVRHWISCLFIL